VIKRFCDRCAKEITLAKDVARVRRFRLGDFEVITRRSVNGLDGELCAACTIVVVSTGVVTPDAATVPQISQVQE
jgi:hypothetical protein